ncbi:MAG: molybdopterin-dependent oxidoreductase [Burkholderiales bacterium]|nr:molybdopterin-dependent oxidoreductase [Burkholderiales bacterium]
MSESGINRRDFLKVLGLGGGSLALAGCGNTDIRSGDEVIMPNVSPEDFVVPGLSVFYASTCTQCGSACGVMGRVREGRVLKMEGNPESRISGGKICGLGQAAVQVQYNPDRLTDPMVREGGKLVPTTWDKAMAMLDEKVGSKSGISGEEFGFMTGAVSGHLKVLVQNYLESMGSKNHYVYEALSPAIGFDANRKVYGVDQPRLHFDKARLILSFGSDFLGTVASPVHFAAEYAKFRKAPRGTLVQIEPKMTMTGANADRWIPIIPGTEGVFALGVANVLMQHAEFANSATPEVAALLKKYDKNAVSVATGVRPELVAHVASMLWEKSPSIVISGASAEGHAHGAQNAMAIQLLNKMLGNVGKTVDGQTASPFPQLAPSAGSFAALKEMNDAMGTGKLKAIFIHGANPVFTAPSFMGLRENLRKVPFKVGFVNAVDETAEECDLVLPILAGVEDFGSHVAWYQPEGVEITLQQPLMNKLYPNTRSMGDIVLDLVKARKPEDYKNWPDFFTYLKTAIVAIKPAVKYTDTDEHFWYDTLSTGVIHVDAEPQQISSNFTAASLDLSTDAPVQDPKFPFYLIPSERHYFRDGRHANCGWLQESPDPLTTIVWDSWAEIHPKTAASMGIKEGDYLEVASQNGSLKVKAYLFPGIHPDAVSIPLGQGHESLGRFAKGVGVNPFAILNPVFEKDSGELAMFATRVSVRKTAESEQIVKDEGPVNTQMGRKLVVTLPADVAQLSKEI